MAVPRPAQSPWVAVLEEAVLRSSRQRPRLLQDRAHVERGGISDRFSAALPLVSRSVLDLSFRHCLCFLAPFLIT